MGYTQTAGQMRKNKALRTGRGIVTQPVLTVHRETMTTERTGKTRVEKDKRKRKNNFQPHNFAELPQLTLLFVSRGGSWGFRQACETLITCSSFRGCSSTLAAKNKVVGDIICVKASRQSNLQPVYGRDDILGHSRPYI